MKKRKVPAIFLLCVVVVAAALGPKLLNTVREMTFYWTQRSDTEIMVKEYAEERGVSFWDYPASLIELLERNPQTEDFVLNYPFREKSGFYLTEEEKQQQRPLFLQWDPRWGYEEYGSDCIGITGCGPTCLAMAGYYVTGDTDFNPLSMAEFSMKNGYYAPGYGSSWTLISEGGVKLGLDVTEIPLVKKRITDNLKVNNPIILAMGPGDFTSEGHYILLVGMEDGLFRVHDPNSPANSQRLWSYEELEGQIRNIWVIR